MEGGTGKMEGCNEEREVPSGRERGRCREVGRQSGEGEREVESEAQKERVRESEKGEGKSKGGR